jgi:hypothetical protein
MEKKKRNVPLILVILLVVAIIGTWTVYNIYYLPSERKSAAYTEVFQDVDATGITSIAISGVNHQVVVKPSEDEKIKIEYFQKIDNSNVFTVADGTVSLTIIERAERLDNWFYQSKRPIDTITVYVPASAQLSLSNHTASGDMTVTDVTLKNLTADSINGNFTLERVTADRLTLSSNYGDAVLDGTLFNVLTLSEVTGNVQLELPDSLKLYNYLFESEYGTVTVNGAQPIVVAEDGVTEQVVSTLTVDNGASRRMNVTGVRNNITVTSVEPAPEETTTPAEGANTEETAQ